MTASYHMSLLYVCIVFLISQYMSCTGETHMNVTIIQSSDKMSEPTNCINNVKLSKLLSLLFQLYELHQLHHMDANSVQWSTLTMDCDALF